MHTFLDYMVLFDKTAGKKLFSDLKIVYLLWQFFFSVKKNVLENTVFSNSAQIVVGR